MEEIDLKSLFDYFLSKAIYIIIITLVALLIGFSYSEFVQKPMYKSYTTILLTKGSDTTAITSNDLTLNKSLVDTYREIIKSRKVIGKVINNLSLDYTVSELNNNISVNSVNDTDIIKISVIDKNAKKAMTIANEIASVFNSEIVKLYNIQNIGVVDEAEVSNAPYNINLFKQLAISGMIGLVLSMGIVFIMFYFDNTVKTPEDIEDKIGLPVIGMVPLTGGKK